MQPKDQKSGSSASLRDDLDSGKGRDKVPYPDPAAAPLGTDDEAAGTPVSEEQLQMARRHELRGAGDLETSAPAVVHGRETGEFDSDATLQPRSSGSEAADASTAKWIAAALAVVLVVLLLLVLLR